MAGVEVTRSPRAVLQLVAFLGVAREGSFTAASAALHKSQPAISKLVRNLEEELGVVRALWGEFRRIATAPTKGQSGRRSARR